MQSVIKFLFVLVFAQFFNAQSSCGMDVKKDIGEAFSKNVKNVENGFYIAKISGKNLWLAMERIDQYNRKYWLDYISVQSNGRALSFIDKARIGTTGDGSQQFKKVLEEISPDKNEIWVAYISKSYPHKIESKDVFGYTAGSLDGHTGPDFPKNIEMFVTVTSNPSALITSHMGIAASVEGVMYGRQKGTSLDLHSFAAKVMLMRNPKRKYMVNAPVFAMEKIIIDALPRSIFIGTREMEEVLKKESSLSIEDFSHQNKDNILANVTKQAEANLKEVKKYFEEGPIREMKLVV